MSCVLRAHPNVAAADEQQWQQVTQQHHRHLVGALGRSGPLLPTEGAVWGTRVAHKHLVLGHRRRAHQGQRPDRAHPTQRVPEAPCARGLLGQNHGNVAVHGHGDKREDADQHTDGGEEVSEAAEEGSEHPLGQRVDGGVQRHASEQEEQVRGAQVHHEHVGWTAAALRPAAGTRLSNHHHHQGVPQHSHCKD